MGCLSQNTPCWTKDWKIGCSGQNTQFMSKNSKMGHLGQNKVFWSKNGMFRSKTPIQVEKFENGMFNLTFFRRKNHGHLRFQLRSNAFRKSAHPSEELLSQYRLNSLEIAFIAPRSGQVRATAVWLGQVRLVRLGQVRFGQVRLGMVRND